MDENRAQNIPILLTASIDPLGRAFVERSDPRVREQDYIGAIKTLLCQVENPIIFCENSGYPLDAIKAALSVRGEGQYEVLQFPGQDFPPSLGKGYGELGILAHAVQHSALLQQAPRFMKITGRYIVRNVTTMLAEAALVPAAVVVAWPLAGVRTFTANFVATPSFVRTRLEPLRDRLNDTKKIDLEIVMTEALQCARDVGEVVAYFKTQPIVTGISGTWNVALDPKRPNGIAWSLPRLRRTLESVAASVRRNLRKRLPR